LLVMPLLGKVTADAPAGTRFMSFAEAQPVLRAFAGSGFAGADVANAGVWEQWEGEKDRLIRARVERGLEDSISNLLIYGVSFTTQPRLADWTQALSPDGELTPVMAARLRDLLAAVQRASPSPLAPAERIAAVRHVLQEVPEAEWEGRLRANLLRFVAEQQHYATQVEAFKGKSETDASVLLRSSLYAARGLSADTSLPPNFAIFDTLEALRRKGVLKPGAIHAIGVVGPGLDFANKRDGLDFYPPQTVQPFAVADAVVRLGLQAPGEPKLVAYDLNPAVLEHARRARDRATYRLQLPLDSDAPWTPEVVRYWQTLGTRVGLNVTPLRTPAAVGKVRMRAVAVAPRWLHALQAQDLDIVLQTALPAPQLDLVVATNILVYYSPFEQALALHNIAGLLAPGGLFIGNTILPGGAEADLEFLGRRKVIYTRDGSFGDDVVVYRKR